MKPENLFFFSFFFEDHLISTGKTVKILVKTFFVCFLFFFWKAFFGPNYSIFPIYFGLYKTGNPSYLSWPLAHFLFPVALGGVEDIRLEPKDAKNPRPRTALPRTDPFEAKDQGYDAEVIFETKNSPLPNFSNFPKNFGVLQKKKFFQPTFRKFSGKYKRSLKIKCFQFFFANFLAFFRTNQNWS